MSEDLFAQADALLAAAEAERAHLALVDSAEYSREEFADLLSKAGWRPVNVPINKAGRFSAVRESSGAMLSSSSADKLLASIASYERDMAARASDSDRPVVFTGLLSTASLQPKRKK